MSASLNKETDQNYLLHCPVCKQIFKEPKCLNCSHAVCLSCLEKRECPGESNNQDIPPDVESNNQNESSAGVWANARSRQKVQDNKKKVELTDYKQELLIKKIICPVCQDETVIDDTLKSLPVHYVYQSDIAVFHSNEAGGPKCGECIDEGDAISYCITCGISMCDGCDKSHKKKKQFQDHDIKPADEIPREQLLKGYIEYCKNHPREELKFFCKDCKISICQVCHISGHHRHDYCFTKDHLRDNKQEVEGMIEKGFGKAECLKTLLDLGQKMIDISGKEKDKSIESIEKAFDDFQNMMTLQKEQLVKKVTDNHKEGKKSLEDAKKRFVVFTDFLKYSQKALVKASQVENIEAMAVLRTQLEKHFSVLCVDQVMPTKMALPPDNCITYANKTASTAKPTPEVFGVVTTPFKECKGNMKVEVQKKVIVVKEDRLNNIIATSRKAMELVNEN